MFVYGTDMAWIEYGINDSTIRWLVGWFWWLKHIPYEEDRLTANPIFSMLLFTASLQDWCRAIFTGQSMINTPEKWNALFISSKQDLECWLPKRLSLLPVLAVWITAAMGRNVPVLQYEPKCSSNLLMADLICGVSSLKEIIKLNTSQSIDMSWFSSKFKPDLMDYSNDPCRNL